MRGLGERVVEKAVKAQKAVYDARGFFQKIADSEKVRMFAEKHERGFRDFVDLFDTAFRPSTTKGQFEAFKKLLLENGAPSFMLKHEALLFSAFTRLGAISPAVSVPILVRSLVARTADFMHLGSDPTERFKNSDSIEHNINKLGEMILGDIEAILKQQEYIHTLENPEVTCLSIKPSNLYSQINPMAFEDSVETVKDRLQPIINAAKENPVPKDSPRTHKLINLDMEDYSDLDITIKAFKDILMQPENMDYQMGIAIQAYMPDAYSKVQELIEFAKERVRQGGAKIRIRLVKGANIPMEQVKASEKGWKAPTYKSKVETDASWKKCLDLLMNPENLNVCELGIASHNTLDIHFANELAAERNVNTGIEFEMLQGMDGGMTDYVVKELRQRVLKYLPTIAREKFLTVLPYYMRRLQELAAKTNYKSHTFKFDPNSPEFKRIIDLFLESIEMMSTVSTEPREKQNRLAEIDNPARTPICRDFKKFQNNSNTNFALPQNRAWVEIINQLQKDFVSTLIRQTGGIDTVLKKQVDYMFDSKGLGEELNKLNERRVEPVFDRSGTGREIGKVEMATREDIDAMVATAKESPAALAWRTLEHEKRLAIFENAIQLFRKHRTDLIVLAGLEVAKQIDQADGEVSEIIDFINTYSAGLETCIKNPNLDFEAKGLVGVISPFNFPLAIGAGGSIAALLAGNSVILKPSKMSRLCANLVVKILHDAGVPEEVLQVLNCEDTDAQYFVSQLDDAVFTGSTEIALKIKEQNPNLNLYAEMGGKNVMYVSDVSDHEKAIKDIVASLKFNGQKCSATSLVCLPPELYGNHEFLKQLVDAVKSLRVGPATNPKSTITPLIQNPNEKLRTGLHRESEGPMVLSSNIQGDGKYKGWLLKPEKVEGREDFYTPGIYIGTEPGDFGHMTELFGPVIDIMCVADARAARKVAKDTGFGLTQGIQSLDKDEIREFIAEADAGVLYVNSSTVGAESGRNSFGGWLNSRVGPGIQAGWPNYVLNFMRVKAKPIEQREIPSFEPVTELEKQIAKFIKELPSLHLDLMRRSNLEYALRSMVNDYRQYFSVAEVAPDKVLGKEIYHRYRPLGKVMIVDNDPSNMPELIIEMVASIMTGNKTEIVLGDAWLDFVKNNSYDFQTIWAKARSLGVDIKLANEQDMLDEVKKVNPTVIRSNSPNLMSKKLKKHFAENGLNIHVDDTPVVPIGFAELRKTLQEQSVSYTYHRMGDNLRPEDKAELENL